MTMRHRKSFAGAVLAIATVVMALSATAAGAQARDPGSGTPDAGARDPRTITVYGSGQVRGTPDVLELTIGVDTRARTASQALHRNSELASNVLAVLRAAGVDNSDLQTTDLSVSPVYDDNGNAVIAYAVTNTVDARIKDLDTAGDIVDAATKVAGDEIVVNGLSFSFDDNAKLVAQARTDAVKRARAQAEQLAAAAGVELGDLQSITESSAPVGPAINAAPEKAAGDAAPVNPGSETLSVDVTLVFEIR
jgi:uncharacterized protein YggE